MQQQVFISKIIYMHTTWYCRKTGKTIKLHITCCGTATLLYSIILHAAIVLITMLYYFGLLLLCKYYTINNELITVLCTKRVLLSLCDNIQLYSITVSGCRWPHIASSWYTNLVCFGFPRGILVYLSLSSGRTFSVADDIMDRMDRQIDFTVNAGDQSSPKILRHMCPLL